MSETPTTVPSLGNLANNSVIPALVSSDAKLGDLVGTSKGPESARVARRKPDTRDLPPGLACRIDTAFLLVESLELDHDQEARARDVVAMDWALLRSSQKDGHAYAVLLRWGATLRTASFKIGREWKPERLTASADRLIDACRQQDPGGLKELLKDLRDVDLVDDARVGKLLLR